MGLPGTKALLHSMAKAINKAASQQSSAWPYEKIRLSDTFSCAGDDIIKTGSLEVLSRHQQAALDYLVKPSDDKWGVYLHGGPYCERFCRNGGVSTRTPWRLEKDYSFVLDAPRTRLLSPETKARRGDEDKNPTFGKMSQMIREVSWVSDPYVRIRAYCSFLRNFRDYGDGRVLMAFLMASGPRPMPLPTQIIWEWLGPELRRALRQFSQLKARSTLEASVRRYLYYTDLSYFEDKSSRKGNAILFPSPLRRAGFQSPWKRHLARLRIKFQTGQNSPFSIR